MYLLISNSLIAFSFIFCFKVQKCSSLPLDFKIKLGFLQTFFEKKCISISFTCLVHSKVESDICKNLSHATGFSARSQLVIDDKGSQSQKFLK